MKGISWTDQRIEALTALYLRGLSCSQIAAEMKIGITRNAVIGKINRLGLTRPFHARPKKQSQPRPKRTRQRSNPYADRWSGAPKLLPVDTSELRRAEVIPRDLTLLELTEGDCRWPSAASPFSFCGHPKFQGSYCASHHFLSIGPGTYSERRATEVVVA